MKKIFIVLYLLVFICVYYTLSVYAIDNSKVYSNVTIDDRFKENAIVMVLKNPNSDLNQLLEPIGNYTLEDISVGEEGDKYFRRIIYLTFEEKNKENILSMIDFFEKKDDVYYVGPDYIADEMSVSYDDFGKVMQWNLNAINIPDAWTVSQGSDDVLVGILDTGIESDHPELQGRVNEALSRDFTSGNEVVGGLDDLNGHGTHVAGIIGAIPNNKSMAGANSGIAGICWNVSLVSLKVMDNRCYASNVIKAIKYADNNGIRVLNFSGGFSDNNIPVELYMAIQAYDGIMVMAAGNENVNINASQMPNHTSFCNFDNVIVVGSSNEDNEKAESSNFGSEVVDVFAPGVNILSLDSSDVSEAVDEGIKVNLCKKLSGTSQAAPHVTGLAALIMAEYPHLEPFEVKKIIIHGADKVDELEGYCKTNGIINAYTSLKSYILLNIGSFTDVTNSLTSNKISAGFYAEKSGLMSIKITGENFGNEVCFGQIISELASEDSNIKIIRSLDDVLTEEKEIVVYINEPGYYCLYLNFLENVMDEIMIEALWIDEQVYNIDAFELPFNKNEIYTLQTNIFSNDKVYKIKLNQASKYLLNYEINGEFQDVVDIVVFCELDGVVTILYDDVECGVGKYSLDINALPGEYYICCFGLTHSMLLEMFIERVLTRYGEEAIVSDPDYSTPVGSQITLAEKNMTDKSYRGIQIIEGFTRLLYLNESIAPSTSRLDYYWYTNNESVAVVSPYGTILALPVTEDTSVKVMAVYKNDLSKVFVKEFTIKEDIANNIIRISLDINIEPGEEKTISLSEVNVPINYLQYYTWISNNDVITVNKYGVISAEDIFDGTKVVITGIYKNNDRIRIEVNVNVQMK